MNQNLSKVYKMTFMAVCLLSSSLSFGQEKHSKTYKESFTVKPEAVVDINVSHTDIAFETWDKNEVSVEATVELEGASAEEAEKFFSENAVEILGNSTLVEIRTAPSAPFAPIPPHMPKIADIPPMPEIAPFFMDLHIPDLPPLPDIPPMPPVPVPKFDYEAYQKDGDKYMKKWKSEFEKNFDKDYREKMESWSEEMAAGAEERRKHMEAWRKEQEKLQEGREEHRKEMEEHRREMEKNRDEMRKAAQEHAKVAREHARVVQRHMIVNGNGEGHAPHIFYFSSGGEGKKLKIKKTIKIKMPKSVKLKMNVRHGEVKLAENTRDLQASLSYARLLATNIDGQETRVVASFSPVNVSKWNYGFLRTDFSEAVSLKEVKQLNLKANSSNVTIDRVLQRAQIENNLGQLRINSVSDSFESMDITVQNGELIFDGPASAYNVRFEGTSSNFTPPSHLNMKKSGDQKQVVYTGFHLNGNSNRSVRINSRYSEVSLQQ